MAPQYFENLVARERAIIDSDFYAEIAEDLKDVEVQRALQIDPDSEIKWQDQQSTDIDLEFV